MRYASLPPGDKDGKSDLVSIMNHRFELFGGSGIPPVHEDDVPFLQREILLEDVLPGSLVMPLKGDEDLSQGRGLKVHRDGSLQNKFFPEYVDDDRHGQKESSSKF